MRRSGQHRHDPQDRRAAGSGPLRSDALRCEGCGTTWFDHVAAQLASGWSHCRRCGGTLHGERREMRAHAGMTRVA